MKAPLLSTYIKPIALGLVVLLMASTAVLQIVLLVLAPESVTTNRAISETFGAGLFMAVTFILGFVIVAVYAVRLSESRRLAYLKPIRTQVAPQS